MPDGLQAIAGRVHGQAVALAAAATSAGWRQTNQAFFDTIRLEGDATAVNVLRSRAEALGINFRYPAAGVVQIALDETVSDADLADLVDLFSDSALATAPRADADDSTEPPRFSLPESLRRRSTFMTHPVFNSHRSETEMMRYIRSLERKDIGLDTAMIPLVCAR
jgi:glycine dehydrogenase